MLIVIIAIIIIVLLATVVDSSPVSCVNGMERAERCLSPFQHHLEKGVAEFVSLSDRDVADACLWVTWSLRTSYEQIVLIWA